MVTYFPKIISQNVELIDLYETRFVNSVFLLKKIVSLNVIKISFTKYSDKHDNNHAIILVNIVQTNVLNEVWEIKNITPKGYWSFLF